MAAKLKKTVNTVMLLPSELGALIHSLRDLKRAEAIAKQQGGFEKSPLQEQAWQEAASRTIRNALLAFGHCCDGTADMVYLAIAAPTMVQIQPEGWVTQEPNS